MGVSLPKWAVINCNLAVIRHLTQCIAALHFQAVDDEFLSSACPNIELMII